MAHNYLAALNLGKFEGIGPLGGEGKMLEDPTTAIYWFARFISNIIGIMTIIAFIWFLFSFLSGAISWLSSSGDKNKLQEAQKKITSALVGLVIVIAAIFIVRLVEIILGIKILSISDLLLNIWK